MLRPTGRLTPTQRSTRSATGRVDTQRCQRPPRQSKPSLLDQAGGCCWCTLIRQMPRITGAESQNPPLRGGGALDLSAEEVTGLKELRLRLAALETDPAPGLLVVGAVICPRDTELHYLFPPSYETRISPGLRLEYDQPVVFDSGLPDLERYMPGLDPALAALTSKVRSGQRAGSEAAPRSRFWWGMNPKQGRVVMGSVHGQAAVPIVLPDPPEPEPWWSPSREVLLRAGSAGN